MKPVDPEKRLKRYVLGLLITALILGVAAYLEHLGILKTAKPLTVANVTRGFDFIFATDVSNERRPDGVRTTSRTPDRLCTLIVDSKGEQVISAQITLVASSAELRELAQLSPFVGTSIAGPPGKTPHVQPYDRDVLARLIDNSNVFESSVSEASSWLKNAMTQYSNNPNAPPIVRSLTDRKLEARYDAEGGKFTIRLSTP